MACKIVSRRPFLLLTACRVRHPRDGFIVARVGCRMLKLTSRTLRLNIADITFVFPIPCLYAAAPTSSSLTSSSFSSSTGDFGSATASTSSIREA